MMSRTYSELIRIPTFEERFDYLAIGGRVGLETFGFNRWLNQQLYTSRDWREFRNKIIIRDAGRDLGVPGFEIFGPITIHHLNPITKDDIINRSPLVLDPENAICVSPNTHRAIHFSDKSLLVSVAERKPNDTRLW